MRFLRSYWGLFLVLFLSIFSILPLFRSGFFPVHDDTQVARVFEMSKSLHDGVFPVRWVQDLGYGYGYPLFNFYAPLAYYVGGFFDLIGFDSLAATRLMMGLGILLAGFFMYLLAREFWGEIGGVVSGLFYVYAPYHAVDIYVRGDVAEFMAYAFIPLVFYGLWKAHKEQKWRFVIVGAIGFAGVILSHNLTAMMLIPFVSIALVISLYSALKKKQFSIFNFQFSIVLLGLFLSAFYWIPALSELKYTNILSQVGGGADFRDHFVCWQQLWNSSWGFAGSAPGCMDGMSFKIGKLHLIVSLLAAISTVYLWRKDRVRSVFILFAIGYLLLAIFLMLEISKPIWEAIKPMAFLQFPWRFLILASFFSSFLAGSLVWFLSTINLKLNYFNTVLYLSGVGLIILLLYFNVKLFQPQTYYPRNSDFYTNEIYLKWTVSKISDEYMPRDFRKPTRQSQIPNSIIEAYEGDKEIRKLVSKTGYVRAKIESNRLSGVKVNIAPFPAWKVFVNGKKTNYVVDKRLSQNINGLYLWIPRGKYDLELRFIQTPVERFANLLSLIGIIILFAGIIRGHFGKNYDSKTP